MNQLSKVDIKTYLNILNDYKKYLGLSEWTIIINPLILPMEAIAMVEPDIYEKELTITLSVKFISGDYKNRQNNILLHELVHARLRIYDKLVEEHLDIMQEHLVNDLTRGLERALKK